MPLVFRTLHRPSKPEALNEEWMVLENTGPGPVSAAGCTLASARHKSQRPRALGTLDPGFVLHPNEQIRLVTGSPSKKTQGEPPDDKKIKNYHLFLREPVLSHAGQLVLLQLKQLELARAVYKPEAKDGLAAE